MANYSNLDSYKGNYESSKRKYSKRFEIQVANYLFSNGGDDYFLSEDQQRRILSEKNIKLERIPTPDFILREIFDRKVKELESKRKGRSGDELPIECLNEEEIENHISFIKREIAVSNKAQRMVELKNWLDIIK